METMEAMIDFGGSDYVLSDSPFDSIFESDTQKKLKRVKLGLSQEELSDLFRFVYSGCPEVVQHHDKMQSIEDGDAFPEEFLIMNTGLMMSFALGKKVFARTKRGKSYGTFWGWNIGPQGCGKSTSARNTIGALAPSQKERTDKGLPKLFTSDVSFEALTDLLARTDRGIGVYYDEGETSDVGRWSNSNKGREMLKTFYDDTPYSVDRLTRKGLDCQGPISYYEGMQLKSETLQTIRYGLNGGFFRRVCYAITAKPMCLYDDLCCDDEGGYEVASPEFCDFLNKIVSLGDNGMVFEFSPEAGDAYRQFLQDFSDDKSLLTDKGVDDVWLDIMNSRMHLIGRFSVLLKVADVASEMREGVEPDKMISRAQVERAAALLGFFLGQDVLLSSILASGNRYVGSRPSREEKHKDTKKFICGKELYNRCVIGHEKQTDVAKELGITNKGNASTYISDFRKLAEQKAEEFTSQILNNKVLVDAMASQKNLSEATIIDLLNEFKTAKVKRDDDVEDIRKYEEHFLNWVDSAIKNGFVVNPSEGVDVKETRLLQMLKDNKSDDEIKKELGFSAEEIQAIIDERNEDFSEDLKDDYPEEGYEDLIDEFKGQNSHREDVVSYDEYKTHFENWLEWKKRCDDDDDYSDDYDDDPIADKFAEWGRLEYPDWVEEYYDSYYCETQPQDKMLIFNVGTKNEGGEIKETPEVVKKLISDKREQMLPLWDCLTVNTNCYAYTIAHPEKFKESEIQKALEGLEYRYKVYKNK